MEVGAVEAGVEVTVTSTTLVVVLGGEVSTEVTVAGGGTEAVTVTGTAGTVLVGGVTTSTGLAAGRPATSSAATSNPVANPASPVTAAEPQVGRPCIRAPPSPRAAQVRGLTRVDLSCCYRPCTLSLLDSSLLSVPC
ncbi:Uncharacterised protein [Amycolatopsis camponoti]|uniref:Uncharacterized protein n=1 Tax=Amycolatopsis camponoti TaxID=2606593 RepID=A0A6I8M3E5_9PSEU|nr:Uncharacterised protein [Amycolatopsis camponoti]